jgi:thiamine biosynthesis lipoprotein
VLRVEVLTTAVAPTPAHWVERRFRAMGTDVHLVLHGTDADADAGEAEIARLEARWSRFVPDSDVRRCNAAAGSGPVEVAPETAALVATAVGWWRATGGRFDPTVLPALLAHGYDDTIAAVRARPARQWSVTSAPPGLPTIRIPALGRPRATSPSPGGAGIAVDTARSTVALPAGVGLDLGGIGKGAAADRVADRLRARGVTAACVGIGGDVRAFGHGSGPHGWTVPVEDPLAPGTRWRTHPVADGAIVTTTDRFRRWHHDGRLQHHLIDPATGRPADSGLTAVVVAHPSATAAEALATAAYVAGPAHASALVRTHGGRCWTVAADGTRSGDDAP